MYIFVAFLSLWLFFSRPLSLDLLYYDMSIVLGHEPWSCIHAERTQTCTEQTLELVRKPLGLLGCVRDKAR